ncbi:MAG: tetratricopeptide repeat protein [Chthoniobacterales bacterium]
MDNTAPPAAPKWISGYQVRYLVRVAEKPEDFPERQSILVSLPAGGWLRPDGADVVVQSASGKTLPTAVPSYDPGSTAIVQFQREGNSQFYWVYAASPGAEAASFKPIAQEGIIAEYRDWKGDVIDSWESVRKGLEKSDTLIGNAVVSQVVQKANPVHPDNPRNFAASYRGFLNISTPGTYKFLLNADDAGFLFIDGYKVFESTGTHKHVTGKVERDPFMPIELTAGVHTFEAYHVMGNSPNAQGYAGLSWVTPDKKVNQWAFVPTSVYTSALSAQVAGVENSTLKPVPVFGFGIDDTLTSDGINLYLARFEAQGEVTNPQQLVWDFGDGSKGTGRTVEHIYFTPGDYKVSLKSPAIKSPYVQTVYVYTAPVATSPFSLAIATKLFAAMDWMKFDPQRINTIFDFLLICEQKERWPQLEKLSRYLLTLNGNDAQRRKIFYVTLMQAMAEQGKGVQAAKLMDTALNEFRKLPNLQVQVMLTMADIYRINLKDYDNAGRLYEKLINEHRGTGTPEIRLAAIHWGDMFAETGDIPQADAHYRMAKDLGGEKFQSSGSINAIRQGALLRIADQRLHAGDVRQSRRLLERMELDFPEQKLQGFYLFLRAESYRNAGRYEDAIRNYEVLLKLSQWSGYRDQAFYGIADCYYRMGEFDKTLKCLDTLKESFPEFYEKKKIAKYRQVVEAHIAHADKKPAAASTDIEYAGFITGFEPDEHQNPGKPENFKFTPLLGMMGPHVGLMVAYKDPLKFNYLKPVSNMTPNSCYWVEFWYRDWMGGSTPSVTVSLMGSNGDTNDDGGMVTMALDRTFGQWRKSGVLLKAPVSQDGVLNISFPSIYGTLMMDAVKILPVTDRENDALNNFVQGSDPL